MHPKRTGIILRFSTGKGLFLLLYSFDQQLIFTIFSDTWWVVSFSAFCIITLKNSSTVYSNIEKQCVRPFPKGNKKFLVSSDYFVVIYQIHVQMLQMQNSIVQMSIGTI